VVYRESRVASEAFFVFIVLLSPYLALHSISRVSLSSCMFPVLLASLLPFLLSTSSDDPEHIFLCLFLSAGGNENSNDGCALGREIPSVCLADPKPGR